MKIDFDKWKGKKVKLADFHIYQTTTKLRPKPTWFCKLYTEVLETIEGEKIRASRLFQLRAPNEWKSSTHLGEVLKHYNVKDIKELLGKEVIITIKNKPDGSKWLEWKHE